MRDGHSAIEVHGLHFAGAFLVTGKGLSCYSLEVGLVVAAQEVGSVIVVPRLESGCGTLVYIALQQVGS